MKKTPERIERLAAEYVLGALQGRARQRFERWMMESVRVRQEVWYWEETLGRLASQVPEKEPPASAWHAIERRLGMTEPAIEKTHARSRLWWPAWSSLATAAALVMAIMLLQQPSDSSALSGAVVQSDVDSPLWLITESPTERRLRLRPVAAESAQAGKDYELWIVPDAGAPLSLGVISVDGVYQVELSDRDREILGRSRTLAISLEPRGGSPTGAPTGPILHVATLYDM